MKTFTIIVYNDPSHAWGKVKRKVLDNLGIAQQVSSHSYQYKDNVYLEEDADLALVCRNLLFNSDVQIKFVEKHTNRDSRIRSYERYAA
jgi:hypothetical protein